MTRKRSGARQIVSIKVVYQGKEIPAQARRRRRRRRRGAQRRLGDHQNEGPRSAARSVPTPRSAYDFAEPIFRLGNDYSKGIILSTGYVGQRTANGLVTCLTDGHPGVSGGGVLEPARRSRRHPDRPDAGRLPLLVHPADARGDAPQDSCDPDPRGRHVPVAEAWSASLPRRKRGRPSRTSLRSH